MSNRKAIVFDLDDTLYLEEDYVQSGFRSVSKFVAEAYGRDELACFATLWKLHQDGVRGNTFDVWLEEIALQHPIGELVSVYQAHEPKLTPLDGVAELLSDLAAEFALGLVTDGYLEVQERKLHALGLGPLFDSVVFSDSFGRECWKPSPVPFKNVLLPLEITPSAAVYIGDNPMKDFLGARNAGMSSIRIRHVGGLYSAIEPESKECEPDVELQSFSEVHTAVAELLK